jgi:hypothetical protein
MSRRVRTAHANPPTPGVWERWKASPDADVEAFARLVLDYVGPFDEPMLDGDAELRRRAKAIIFRAERSR